MLSVLKIESQVLKEKEKKKNKMPIALSMTRQEYQRRKKKHPSELRDYQPQHRLSFAVSTSSKPVQYSHTKRLGAVVARHKLAITASCTIRRRGFANRVPS